MRGSGTVSFTRRRGWSESKVEGPVDPYPVDLGQWKGYVTASTAGEVIWKLDWAALGPIGFKFKNIVLALTTHGHHPIICVANVA